MKPVVITIGGAELTTWTEMTLSRSKKEMTGSLSVTIFGGSMPPSPILRSVNTGSKIQVYIGGQLAFTGSVDKRQGSGQKTGKKGASDQEETKGDTTMSVNIGPNEYTIKITARGETKRLVDSSHQHPTTNMMQPKTKKVVEKLIEPWKIQLDWKAKDIQLDKMRFRDGAIVLDELHRVAKENAYFMHETKDGKLRVTDGVGTAGGGGGGDPIILGYNILTFNAEQTEDKGKSKIKTKGQRTKKDKWGKKALEKTFKEIQDKSVKDFVPLTIQHYGDGTDEELERRGRFEANMRNTESKKITVEVFHVQTPSGNPWDVGNMHYVEVPPEGIFEMFECTELEYHADTEKLKTKLVLNPPPSGGTGGGAGGFGLSNISTSAGEARRSQAGIQYVVGQYPDPWTGAQLSELPQKTLVEAEAKGETEAQRELTEEEKQARNPPLELPPWMEETGEGVKLDEF